jgi:maleylacetoacetate isomerase
MPEQQDERVVLHGCWRSTCTHRVLLALHLRRVPFRYVPVSLDTREQEGEAFRALSPDAQLPVLVVDGEPVAQSMAIIDLIEALGAAGTAPLFPSERMARARAIAIAERVGSFVQPFTLPGGVRRPLIAAMAESGQSAVFGERLAHFIRKTLSENLKGLDEKLAASGGLFFGGAGPSVGDVFVYPQLVGAARLGIDVNGFPRLSKLYEAMGGLDAVRAADPTRLPDAPQQRGAAPA